MQKKRKKNDFIFNIRGSIELIDTLTHSKRRFNFNNFNMLKDLDLKFNWGIFIPKKEKEDKKDGR